MSPQLGFLSPALAPIYRDGEGVGLCEEQVPALEVIVEVEESAGEGGRQEAVRPPPRPPCLTPGGPPTCSLGRCRPGAPASTPRCQGPGRSCLHAPGGSGPCAVPALLGSEGAWWAPRCPVPAHRHPPCSAGVTAGPGLGRGVSPRALKTGTHVAGAAEGVRCTGPEGPRGWGGAAGSLAVTFYGTTAHQVGEGEVQGPVRGEVGLCQAPHALAHLQKQLGALTAHDPSPGQLPAEKEGPGRGRHWKGGPCPRPTSTALHPRFGGTHPPNCSMTATRDPRSGSPSSTLGRGLGYSRSRKNPPQEMPGPLLQFWHQARAWGPPLTWAALSTVSPSKRSWGVCGERRP